MQASLQGAAEAATALAWVGNDVVALRDPEARGKIHDLRFVHRVLNATERPWLESEGTDRALWTLWSAKESAHKLIFKMFGVSSLARELSVSIEPLAANQGRVRWRDHVLSVRWDHTDEYVHCVALAPSGSWSARPIAWAVEEAAAEQTSRSAPSSPSEAVRSLARRLFADLGVSSSPELGIVRARVGGDLQPPRLHRRGEPVADCDLSLSHHGRFVAAVATCAPEDTRRQGAR